MFFQKCFPYTRTYIIRDGGKIASSISMIPLSYFPENGKKEIKGSYLYGVCTLPEYRGNKLSIKLIEYAEEEYREKGYNYVITRPATPPLFAFYRKIGYSQPVYRQYTDITLPLCPDEVTYSELNPSRLQQLRKKHLNYNYYEWEPKMMDYIIHYIKFYNGFAIELDSNGYIIGYPDGADDELINVFEIGTNSQNIQYPTLFQVGNYLKSRYVNKTKARIFFPIFKQYSDLDKVEKEAYVLLKPLSDFKEEKSFFNFTME